MGMHHGRVGDSTFTKEEEEHFKQLAENRRAAEKKRAKRFEMECQVCGAPFTALEENAQECPDCAAAAAGFDF